MHEYKRFINYIPSSIGTQNQGMYDTEQKSYSWKAKTLVNVESNVLISFQVSISENT